MILELNIRSVIGLFAIIIVGLISTYTDTKNQTISNRMVLAGIISGLIINLSYTIFEFKINYLINIFFALFIGFFLWQIKFWNAGDGKLFLTFITLMPINLVFQNKFYLYSYNLITYTFIPVFCLFLITLFFQTKLKEFIHAFKEAFQLKTIASIMIAFFSFQWVIQLVNKYVNFHLNLFISALILFIIFEGIDRIIKIKLIHLFYITSTIRLIIEFNTVSQLNYLIYFFSQLLLFLIVVYFFIYLAYFKFGTHVKIPNLKKGMLLCETIIKKNKNYYTVKPNIKISLFMFLQDSMPKEKPFIDINSKGLTIKEIQKLQELNKAGKIDVGSLLIQKRIPYAPFQFIGVIVLIIISIL